MNIRFNTLVIGAIAFALLIVGGAYFVRRWIYRDLPDDTSKFPQPSAATKVASVNAYVWDKEATANAPDRSNSGDASADSPVLSDEADRVKADLEQTRLQLKAWGDDYLKQFPDVPAVEATVEDLQELLRRVTDQNQQLKEEGVPI